MTERLALAPSGAGRSWGGIRSALRPAAGRKAPVLVACLALALLGVGLLAAPGARAAQGDLDPAFGAGGKVVNDFDPQVDVASGVAVQDDGKIVTVGTAGYNGGGVIARYDQDGSLDQSFGTGGKVPSPVIRGDKVALQRDGKIVVAGAGTSCLRVSGNCFAVARYNRDGTPDMGFGGGGEVVTAFPPPPGGGTDQPELRSKATALTFQPDGKIVAAGRVEAILFGLRSGALGVVRYASDGSLDSSFGNGGRALVGRGPNPYGDEAGVALQADGKVVAAAASTSGASPDFLVARFTPLGQLDASFGGNGMVTTNLTTTYLAGGGLSPSADTANDVAVQSDGKIVAAGTAGPSAGPQIFDDPSRDFALVRYNADGSLDQSFDGDGKVLTDAGGSDSANAIALQGDGKILAAGSNPSAYVPSQGRYSRGDFVLFRYAQDGSLDPSFGAGGKVTTSFGSDVAVADDVAIQPDDGKIVAAGQTSNGTDYDFALARYQGQPPSPPPGGGGGGTTTGTGSGLTSTGSTTAATADTAAPGVTGYAITNNPFVVSGGKTPTFGSAAKAKKHKKGTMLRYRLSEAATVKILIAQRRPGRRRGRRCVAPTRRLRKARKCIRLSTRGTLTRTSHKGANGVAFSGRIGFKALEPGSYQATLTATDAARNTAKPQTITFRIVKR